MAGPAAAIACITLTRRLETVAAASQTLTGWTWSGLETYRVSVPQGFEERLSQQFGAMAEKPVAHNRYVVAAPNSETPPSTVHLRSRCV